MQSPETILESFPIGTPRAIAPLGNGRIHTTLLVTTGDTEYVLQKVGSLFGKTAHDIDAITTHLATKCLMTSRLIRTHSGTLTVPDGECAWRLMTFIPGSTIEENPSPTQAASGASFVARFHTALLDYTDPFAYCIPGYRDTRADFARLREVSEHYRGSEKYQICNPIAEDIHARTARLTENIASLPLRVCHGDLKLNNLRFDATQTNALALIDLDTVGHYPLPLELGDMLRSFCRTEQNTINTELWHTTMTSYREAALFLTDEEWRLIPDGFVEITLSLASRYLTDAYEETWFKHDASYPSLFEQNFARARASLDLIDSFMQDEAQVQSVHSS